MRVGDVLFGTELVSVHMLSIVLVIHLHAIDAREIPPYCRQRRTRFFKQALYKPSFVRRQCRRFEFQRILLPVRMRIHWGMGRFWAIFFASVRFVRKVLCDGCGGNEG